MNSLIFIVIGTVKSSLTGLAINLKTLFFQNSLASKNYSQIAQYFDMLQKIGPIFAHICINFFEILTFKGKKIAFWRKQRWKIFAFLADFKNWKCSSFLKNYFASIKSRTKKMKHCLKGFISKVCQNFDFLTPKKQI